MFSNDDKKTICIKRANTDWWIHEQAMVGNNGKTYIAYSTDMGEIHVKEIDAKCSRAESHDVCLCRMNCTYADEHNSPSICVMENGTIIVAYTGHGATHNICYRITKSPYDIFSFGEEHVLEYEKSVTYAQLSENVSKGELWLFCRVDSVTWEFRFSKDEGLNWSVPNKFLISDAGGLFYFDIRKQWKPSRNGVVEQWFFALYGHPLISKDHTIHSGIFDRDGNLLTMEGNYNNVNLYGEGTIDIESLDVVYESPADSTCRLLAVSPTLPCRVGFATFNINQPETIEYYSSTFEKDKWVQSNLIATGGEFLSPANMIDGSQTYVAGMAYYYGVGDAGLFKRDYTKTHTNIIYLARFDGESRTLESYITYDNGKNYELKEVMRKIPKEEDVKIWRPIVPMYAQDNLPVYWHEGYYGAHTGGWRCDVVMFVDFDD